MEIYSNTTSALEILKEVVGTCGYLFYATVKPFETVQEVPDYVTEVVPFFVIMVVLEQVYLYSQGKCLPRINDTVGSVSQGMLMQLTKVFFVSCMVSSYAWIYDHFAIVHLPWNSLWTWFFCLIGFDLCYYWFHRTAHEVNFMWASHQAHHSSEDFNMATGLRQSIFQSYISLPFYWLLALCIPPSIYWAHYQLNAIFQFWLHTQVVGKLGPLEYIFNTPSHHRVHHGRNRYCIDKNYAGTLIIWDRLFGTFQQEEEEVVYGLTHSVETFDSFYIQFHHYLHIWRTFRKAKGIRNKLSVLFKGPGWEPGKPRLGNIEDIPDIHAPMPKYDPKIPIWCNIYVLVHFACIGLGYVEIDRRYSEISQRVVTLSIAYLILSLTAIGAILDKKFYAPVLEFLRCLLFMSVDSFIIPLTSSSQLTPIRMVILCTARIIYVSSAFLWGSICARNVVIRIHSRKIK